MNTNQPTPPQAPGGEIAAPVEDHPWPDCKEVQCKQVHECLNSIMELLGTKCDDNIFVVGKAIRISEAIQSLQSQLDAARAKLSELESCDLIKDFEDMRRERDELRQKLAEAEKNRGAAIASMNELSKFTMGKDKNDAQTIDELHAQVETLKGALRPFAELGKAYDGCGGIELEYIAHRHNKQGMHFDVTIGDFRSAKSAMEGI